MTDVAIVTKADREAALNVRIIQLGHAVKLPNDGHYLIQAFAAHAHPLRVALETILNHDGVAYRYGDEIRAIARAALGQSLPEDML